MQTKCSLRERKPKRGEGVSRGGGDKNRIGSSENQASRKGRFSLTLSQGVGKKAHALAREGEQDGYRDMRREIREGISKEGRPDRKKKSSVGYGKRDAARGGGGKKSAQHGPLG